MIIAGIEGEVEPSHKNLSDYFSDKLEVFYFDLAIHYDISENHEKAIKFLSSSSFIKFLFAK